jgi:hypothetical protein
MNTVNGDPNWFWRATFSGGSTATFYADSKALAWDHAGTLARDFGRERAVKVTRLKRAKDVTPAENAAAGKEQLSPLGRALGHLLRRDQ